MLIFQDEAETTEVTEAIEEDNEVVENIQEVTNEVGMNYLTTFILHAKLLVFISI